jgi:hypothetical protein
MRLEGVPIKMVSTVDYDVDVGDHQEPGDQDLLTQGQDHRRHGVLGVAVLSVRQQGPDPARTTVAQAGPPFSDLDGRRSCDAGMTGADGDHDHA